MLQLIDAAFNKLKCGLNIGSKPDFIILGVQKSGTTSLFYTIENCAKEFCSPRNKELYFFSENYYRGLRYYKAQFPLFRKRGDVTGEATPDYFYYHLAPERIKEFDSQLKFVVVLRDPIERAFSQYNHQNFTRKTVAYDPLSFSDAIRIEENRFCVQKESDYFYEYKYYSYKQRGLYEEQIERWYEKFDREQFFFLDISELNDKKAMNSLFSFLGLSLDGLKNQNFKKVYNKNETNTFSLKAEDEKYLLNYYRGRFTKIEELTGRTFPWLQRYL